MDIRAIKNQIDNNEETTTTTTTSVIKEALEAPKVVATPEVKLAKRKEPISFSYIMDDGSAKSATIVSMVLDGERRSKMVQIQMALAGGLSFDSLPRDEQGRIVCLARIATQVEKCPDWVLEKASEDMEFCFELATMLVEHETRFFRSNAPEGEEAPQRKRFSFSKTAS